MLAQLRQWLAAEPRVQQAFYVTGEADFVLIVTAPSTEAYDALMSRASCTSPRVPTFGRSIDSAPTARFC